MPTNKFDFDTLVERRHSGSKKWDKYADSDILPLWVADMDFASAPAIIEALQARVNHRVFGYANPPEGLAHAVIERLEQRYAWKIDEQHLHWLPNLWPALQLVAREFTTSAQAVIVTPPIYPPFLAAPRNAGRRMLRIDMQQTKDYWEFDFDRFEASLVPNTRLLLLCNPHNPIGRVYTQAELERICDICLRHDLLICSDEIHCDLILDADKRHIPIASIDTEIAARTITLMSASKTFNLAGLQCAFAIISEPSLARQFAQARHGILSSPNCMGFSAMYAAFTRAAGWHQALLDYLRDNREVLAQAIQYFPGVSMTRMEATYLAWLDFRDTGIKDPAAFCERAGVGLSDGADFGWPGFLRLNFGCSRVILDRALQRLADAFQGVCT